MPATFEALAVVLVSIAPGVLFMELSRSWAPQADRSTLRDLGLVVAASAVSTIGALTIIHFGAGQQLGWEEEIELALQFVDGDRDLSDLGLTNLTVGLVSLLGLSLGIAYLLALGRRKLAGGQGAKQLDPWAFDETDAPADTIAYFVLDTTDGGRWMGRTAVYETSPNRAKRQVVLARPILHRGWGGNRFEPQQLLDEIGFDGDQISTLGIVHLDSETDADLHASTV
ncbi:MAG: DUF6338 family protein [Actinomycetota bacterium]